MDMSDKQMIFNNLSLRRNTYSNEITGCLEVMSPSTKSSCN